MGPPNPPNLDTRKGRIHYDKTSNEHPDSEGSGNQVHYLSNYQIQNLAQQGGNTTTVLHQPSRNMAHAQPYSQSSRVLPLSQKDNGMQLDSPAMSQGQFIITSREQPVYGAAQFKNGHTLIQSSSANFIHSASPSLGGSSSGYSSFSNFNSEPISEIKYGTSDTLPVISGDILLP